MSDQSGTTEDFARDDLLEARIMELEAEETIWREEFARMARAMQSVIAERDTAKRDLDVAYRKLRDQFQVILDFSVIQANMTADLDAARGEIGRLMGKKAKKEGYSEE